MNVGERPSRARSPEALPRRCPHRSDTGATQGLHDPRPRQQPRNLLQCVGRNPRGFKFCKEGTGEQLLKPKPEILRLHIGKGNLRGVRIFLKIFYTWMHNNFNRLKNRRESSVFRRARTLGRMRTRLSWRPQRQGEGEAMCVLHIVRENDLDFSARRSHRFSLCVKEPECTELKLAAGIQKIAGDKSSG